MTRDTGRVRYRGRAKDLSFSLSFFLLFVENEERESFLRRSLQMAQSPLGVIAFPFEDIDFGTNGRERTTPAEAKDGLYSFSFPLIFSHARRPAGRLAACSVIVASAWVGAAAGSFSRPGCRRAGATTPWRS